MRVRYLGPAGRLVIGAVKIRRGETGEITKAEYAELGPKQSRVEVVPAVRPRRAPASRSKPKKKES